MEEPTRGMAEGEKTFEEFHAGEMRKRRDRSSAAPASKPQEENKVQSYSVRDAVGNFVEKFEVQLLVILLIGLDVVTVSLELFMNSGVIELRTPLMTNISQLMQSFTGFTVFFFLMEVGLVFFAFGGRCITHMGYMVDLIIVVFGLYWELNMDSKVIRLFGILRVWRIVRLMNSMLADAEARHAATAQKLQEQEQKVEKVLADKGRVEEKLSREIETRKRVESAMQGYKDENETLHEALQIAAVTAAETQLLEDEDFLNDLEASDDETPHRQGSEEVDVDGDAFLEADNNGGNKKKFVVLKDGSFSSS